jgi:hypothetical protein
MVATVTVNEFTNLDPTTREPIWPAVRTSTVVVPGTVSTIAGTVLVSITSDASCRSGIGQPASKSSTPIIADIENTFFLSGTVTALNFL